VKFWLPPRSVRVFLFGCYAGFMFVGTHWPAFTIPMPGRPDLVMHLVLFGLWTAMCIGAEPFGPMLSLRNILASQLLSVIYAGIDEGLQAIPFIRRAAALDDFGANTCGVLGVTLVALTLRRFLYRTRTLQANTFSEQPT